MLTGRITVPSAENPEGADFLYSGLNALFRDDAQNSHGDPGEPLNYGSPIYGKLKLRVPAEPDTGEGRSRFAHYLWNAGVKAAELIESGSSTPPASSQEHRPFNVKGKSTLELGAGTALPSVMSALCGATRVVITDHPDTLSISAGTIAANVASNLFPEGASPRTEAQIDVRGYVWGEATLRAPSTHGQAPALAASSASASSGRFDRLLICDCLWKPAEHGNLVTSILTWLEPSPSSAAIVVAGYHPDRSVVNDFFNLAAGEDTDGRGTKGPLSISEIFEIDVDNARREWQSERAGETPEEAKRWCVVGVLTRR